MDFTGTHPTRTKPRCGLPSSPVAGRTLRPPRWQQPGGGHQATMITMRPHRREINWSELGRLVNAHARALGKCHWIHCHSNGQKWLVPDQNSVSAGRPNATHHFARVVKTRIALRSIRKLVAVVPIDVNQLQSARVPVLMIGARVSIGPEWARIGGLGRTHSDPLPVNIPNSLPPIGTR